MEMMYQAVSIGEAVPRRDFEAVIHSVFDRALNLQLAREDGLLTVLLSRHYDLPQGIRIDRDDITFPPPPIGSAAACRAGILRFESHRLAVDLRGAAEWKSAIAGLEADMRATTARRSWGVVWQRLNRRQRLENAALAASDLFDLGSGSQLTQKMREPIRRLMSATGRLDDEAAVGAARELIGLGPGVTPAGDDFLIGFLAGLWSTGAKSIAQLEFLSALGSGFREIASSTNLISRTYVMHATRAQFPSSLSRLMEAITAGSEDLPEAADSAMQVGHSSGMDAVTGMLIGLWNWVPDDMPQELSLSNSKI